MRWPWKKRDPDPAGMARARQALAKAQADEPRIADIAEQVNRRIRENHFGPKIAAAFREGHQ